MKGNNILVLNAATVTEAMQEYLDKRAYGGKADKVDSVSFTGIEYRFSLSERKQESKEEGKK